MAAKSKHNVLDIVSLRTLVTGIICGVLVALIAVAVYSAKKSGKIIGRADDEGVYCAPGPDEGPHERHAFKMVTGTKDKPSSQNYCFVEVDQEFECPEGWETLVPESKRFYEFGGIIGKAVVPEESGPISEEPGKSTTSREHVAHRYAGVEDQEDDDYYIKSFYVEDVYIALTLNEYAFGGIYSYGYEQEKQTSNDHYEDVCRKKKPKCPTPKPEAFLAKPAYAATPCSTPAQ